MLWLDFDVELLLVVVNAFVVAVIHCVCCQCHEHDKKCVFTNVTAQKQSSSMVQSPLILELDGKMVHIPKIYHTITEISRII